MLIEISPSKFDSYLFKGISLARVGDFDEAMFHLESAAQFAYQDYDMIHVKYAMANYYALKGEKENCITHFDNAAKEGGRYFAILRTDPTLISILSKKELMEICDAAMKNETK